MNRDGSGSGVRLSDWLRDHGDVLLACLIALHLIPVWAFGYFPTQDGACHVGNAAILRGYNLPDHTAFRQYYTLNAAPVTNWLGHAIMAALMFVVSPLVAEKILLSGYVVLFPLSVRYALKGIRAESGFLAVLSLPFIYNFLLYKGFYNFSCGIVLFFVAMGYWWRCRSRWTTSRVVVLMSIFLFLCFSHPMVLAAAYVSIAVLATWTSLQRLARPALTPQTGGNGWMVFRDAALVPLLAAVPSLILFLPWMSTSETSPPAPPPDWSRMLLDLGTLAPLVSHDPREVWFSTAVAVIFVVTTVALLTGRAHRVAPPDSTGFLVLAGVFLALYLLLPGDLGGGGLLKERLALFPFFSLILWFGSCSSSSRRLWPAITAAAVAIGLPALGLRIAKHAELTKYVAEYLSVMPYVEPNSTLLPVSYASQRRSRYGPRVSEKIRIFLHLAGYIAAEKGVVDLGNYEASKDYFPLRFRPHLNPFRLLALDEKQMQLEPPRLQKLDDYARWTGGRVDYVLVWGIRGWPRSEPHVGQVLKQLSIDYELVYSSGERGAVQLYRRKGSS